MKQWIEGLVAVTLIGLAAKYLPKLIAGQLGSELDKLLAMGDANDDELILAMVKWADKKIPGGDSGHLKYAAVANMVAARFPMISAEKLDELIEKSVDRMKEEAEKRLASTGNPPLPPA